MVLHLYLFLIHLFVVLVLHLLLTILNISKRKKGRAEERKKEEFFSSFPSTSPSDTVRVGKNSFTNGGIFQVIFSLLTSGLIILVEE